MRTMQEIYNEIKDAAKIHDKDIIKEKLLELHIRRQPNKIINIYRDFVNNIHGSSAKELLDFLLIKALEKGDTPWAKYLIESEELRVHANVNSKDIWKCAVDEGNLEVIQCLVNNKKYESGGVGIVNSLGFKNIFLSVDIVKYLVDDESMPYHQEVWFQLEKNAKRQPHGFYMIDPLFDLFINACASGSLSVIDFVSQHKKLRGMINKTSFEQGLLVACSSDNVQVIKHLLTNPNMPYKCPDDIHYEWLINVVNSSNVVDIAKYIVFDLKIPESDYKPKENNTLIEKMFDIRRNHDQLVSELGNRSEAISPQQKRKI